MPTQWEITIWAGSAPLTSRHPSCASTYAFFGMSTTRATKTASFRPTTWRCCLEMPQKMSVMLDMAPGYGSDGLRGKIEMTSLNEPYTDETLHAFTYKPVRPMLVKDINFKDRDAFNFSPEWEGCRFWMSVVMKAWKVKTGSR